MLGINAYYTTIDKLFGNDSLKKEYKAILFSNPNNPSGYVLKKREMGKIVQLAKKHDLYIIFDEVYSETVYSKFISFSKFDYNKTVIVDSASKKLNNCGARIGAVITKNEKVLTNLYKIYDSRISISNTEQIAICNMLKNKNKIFKKNLDEYISKKEAIKKF